MVHGDSCNYVRPRDALILGNDRWEDETVEEIEFPNQVSGTTLDPGESITALEIISNDRENTIAVFALATSRHPSDINNDNTPENVVRYSIQDKPDDPTDTYNELPGLTTTMPFGDIGTPIRLLPGNNAVGPMYSFRVVVENRSDGFANPVSIPLDKIGVACHARILRNTTPSDIMTTPSPN